MTDSDQTAYVTDYGYFAHLGTVTPISTASNTAGKPIHVGQDPWGIAITPDGKTAYVADQGLARARPSAKKPIPRL